jgi:hypothetical protein
MATSNALAAYVEITHKIERVDREWQRLDAAYQALVSPVSVAVQGSPERAVREIRQRQLADFNTAANAIKSSLAAPVSMLAYTVVQEARNGRLDAQDYRNLQRIGVATSGLAAAVVAAKAGVSYPLKKPAGVSDAAWRTKLGMLNAAAARGEARVVHSPTRSGTAQREARSSGMIEPGHDADHALDLQFGGADSMANITSTATRVNRSVGAQGRARMAFPDGTPIKEFVAQ